MKKFITYITSKKTLLVLGIFLLLLVCSGVYLYFWLHPRNVSVYLSDSLPEEGPAERAPLVTTDRPENITQTEATIVGTVVSLGGAETVLANFIFEGNVTAVSNMTATGRFSVRETSLHCGTTYSFNAVAVNSSGTTDGPTRVFKTLSCEEKTPLAKKKK